MNFEITTPLILTFTNEETGEVYPLGNITEIKAPDSSVDDTKRFLTNSVTFHGVLTECKINNKFARKVIFKGHPFKYLKWRLTNFKNRGIIEGR